MVGVEPVIAVRATATQHSFVSRFAIIPENGETTDRRYVKVEPLTSVCLANSIGIDFII